MKATLALCISIGVAVGALADGCAANSPAAPEQPPALGPKVAGTGGAIFLAVYLWRHPKVNNLAMEIVVELSKVTWPTRKELSASTVVVIILSVIASIILGLFDFFWAWCTDLIYHSG